jgi:hypothetical protein
MSTVSCGKQTGRKEAKASSKPCLYFACSDHRIRNNCLGECHNEHTRNWKESHVLRKPAISRDCLVQSNIVRSESFPLQTSAR